MFEGNIDRSLIHFYLGSLPAGIDVLSADLRIWNNYSPTCSAKSTEVRRVLDPWTASSTTWANQPSVGASAWATTTASYGGSGCAANWLDLSGGGDGGIDMGVLVQRWLNGTYTNSGVEIRASDETDANAWKNFNSLENATHQPYLTVTYNTPPNAPTGLSPASGSWTNDSTPTLSGVFSDPDGGTGHLDFTVKNPAGTTVASGTGSTAASGSRSSWSIPTLQDGTTYTWTATADDGTDTTPQTGSQTLKTDLTPPTATVSCPGSANWSNAASTTCTITGSDPNAANGSAGSGLATLEYRTQLNGGSWSSWTTVSSGAQFTVSSEGITNIQAQAIDNAGNSDTTPSTTVELDRTAPTLTLSGTLANDEGQTLTPGQYPLDMTVQDGSGSTPSSGAAQLAVTVDGTSQSGVSFTPCSPGPCQAAGSWTLDTTQMTPGSHTIAVTATDGAANSTTQSFSITVAQPPSNNVSPTVSGTDQDGQTLTASPGTWSGTSPISYSYQWQSCDPNGNNCTNIANATGQTYQLGPGDDGSTVQVSVTASNSAGSASVRSNATSLVEPATGPPCTDSWTGATGDGNWDTVGNWSDEQVPGGSDVTCARSGSQITIGGTDQTGSLQAYGATISLFTGSLQISQSSPASQLGSLSISGGQLTNDGQLTIESALTWTGGTIAGAGTTSLAASSSSTISPTAGDLATILDTQQLSNQGSLVLLCVDGTDPTGNYSLLHGTNSAELENTGTMTVSVPGGSGAATGCELQQNGSASLVNNGSLGEQAATGVGVVQVGWQFSSESNSQTTDLDLQLYGGAPAPVDGTWSTTNLELTAGGNYTLADAANFGPSQQDASTITVDGAPSGSVASLADTLAGNHAAPSLDAPNPSSPLLSLQGSGPATIGTAGTTTTTGALSLSGLPVTAAGNLVVPSLNASAGAALTAQGDLTSNGGLDLESNTNISSSGSITIDGDTLLQGPSVSLSAQGNITFGQSGVGTNFNAFDGVNITAGGSVTLNSESDSWGNVNLSGGGGISANTSGNIDEGATLSSPGTINLPQGFELQDATLEGGGNVVLGGTSWFYDATTLNGETLVNDGQLNVQGSNLGPNTITGANSGEIDNYGTITANDTSFDLGQGTASLINETGGTLTNTNDALQPLEFDWQIANQGTLGVSGGVLDFTAGGTPDLGGEDPDPSQCPYAPTPDAGTWTTTNGGAVGFTSGCEELGPGTVFNGQGLISGGELATDSLATCAPGSNASSFTVTGGYLNMLDPGADSCTYGLVIGGGTLEGPGALDVANTMDWNSGALTGGGSTTIDQGASAQIDPGATSTVTVDERTLTNDGSVSWNSGSIAERDGAAFENYGTFNASSTSGAFSCEPADGTSGGSLIVNASVIGDPGASQPTDIECPVINIAQITAPPTLLPLPNLLNSTSGEEGTEGTPSESSPCGDQPDADGSPQLTAAQLLPILEGLIREPENPEGDAEIFNDPNNRTSYGNPDIIAIGETADRVQGLAEDMGYTIFDPPSGLSYQEKLALNAAWIRGAGQDPNVEIRDFGPDEDKYESDAEPQSYGWASILEQAIIITQGYKTTQVDVPPDDCN